jgi:PAS domain S-box-containing protein
MKAELAAKKFSFLEDGGELGALTRGYDWSSTSVGPIDSWPQTLKATVGIILHSDFPMFLWWGEDMVQFYNDAYRPSLGQDGKHPKALGQDAITCWPEIWDIIYPLIHQVKTTGKSFFSEDQLIPIFRNGKIEDVYWTFSYSAVIGDTGYIDGVLVVCNETTRKVNMVEKLRQAQRQLQLSESNLKNMIMQAPVAMAILKGRQHVVEIANDRMFTLWGKSRETLLGKPIFDELHDAKREGFEDLLNHVFETGETFTAVETPVTLYRNNTTEIVYVHFVYEAFREGDGTVSGVMAVAVEVTEHVMSRKQLEQSERRFRSLVESAPFPIGVYEGREMRITMLNQAIIDVWGKGSDLIGKRYHEVLPELENQQIFQQLDSVYATGIPVHLINEPVDLMVDGKLQRFYFNYDFTPLLDASGKVFGVLNTAADVTDLNLAKLKVERSERNFRNMVLQAPVAMCILSGPAHIVEVANDMIIELWGKPPEEVLGKPIFEGLPEAKEQGLEQLLSDVYHSGVAFKANERPIELIRNGRKETVYQNFVYEPYRDTDGAVIGVLAITIDVTEQVIARRKIEEVVIERTESLRKSNAELTQFAYITSHDLQEPARKIGTFADMLRAHLGDGVDLRSKNYLDKIENAAGRMLGLIRDVLSLSQLSKAVQQFESVDLNKILDDVRSDFELLIEQKAGIIESDPLPDINAIPIQMMQLFSNLISNAFKFSSPGVRPKIEIRSRLLEEKEVKASFPSGHGGNYHLISFIDNGIGFSQSNATQIFDIFQRLHSRSDYQGTGIGLAICRKIAENHGGRITASSRPGKGARFDVVLPERSNFQSG